ncbi:hypothetical protein D6833_10640 [Candidatus Parcubacteria bacterium]|nr:MAG: hypothetical protein D6833_10640 [Candidatus Parcubacteria bacterium]
MRNTFLLPLIAAIATGILPAHARHQQHVDPLYPFYALVRVDEARTSYLYLTPIAPLQNYNPRIYWHPECLEGYVRLEVLMKYNSAYRLAYEEAVQDLRRIPLPKWLSFAHYRQPKSLQEKQKMRDWMFAKLNKIVTKPRKQLNGKSLEQMLHLARRKRPPHGGLLVNDTKKELEAWEDYVRNYGIEYFDEVQVIKERAIVYSTMVRSQIANEKHKPLFHHCPGVPGGLVANPNNPLFAQFIDRLKRDPGFKKAYQAAVADLAAAIRTGKLKDGNAINKFIARRFRTIVAQLRELPKGGS